MEILLFIIVAIIDLLSDIPWSIVGIVGIAIIGMLIINSILVLKQSKKDEIKRIQEKIEYEKRLEHQREEKEREQRRIENMIKTFENTYKVRLYSWFTLSVREDTSKDNSDLHYYELQYPYWRYHNKDGTKDNRRNDNKVLDGVCTLHLDNYILTCSNFYYMVQMVNNLRRMGTKIDKIDLEVQKEHKLLQEHQELSFKKSITSIIDKFSQNPTDFEGFCAEIYKAMGYKTTLTPPVNDGGYDIKIENNLESAIVECKCYALTNKIGRPLIQKLVGANQVELADRMIFITTSDFTSSAKKYANEIGVELINGDSLLNMIDKYGKFNISSNTMTKNVDFKLTKQDFIGYVSKDLLDIYWKYDFDFDWTIKPVKCIDNNTSTSVNTTDTTKVSNVPVRIKTSNLSNKSISSKVDN